MRTSIVVAILASALIVSTRLRADPPELPTYSYAIASGTYQDVGVFTAPIHVRVPSSLWLCDITHGQAGLLVRCSMPRLEGGCWYAATPMLPEVITRISCATSDTDAETLHLS